ncbi:MAG TPA: DUF3618 domain-containing protein [Longimicrobiales bacterium]
MAEEIRVVRRQERGRTGPGDEATERAPTSTTEARREIERTRGRISTTLDALEERVDSTRNEIRERLDVLRPVRRQVREHHWASLGIAFGTGVLLSMLFGGKGEEEERRVGRMLEEEPREERRRWRAERRERLSRRAERRRTRRRRGMMAGLGLRRIPGMLAGAVVAGLRDRARRAVIGRGRAPRPRTRREIVA